MLRTRVPNKGFLRTIPTANAVCRRGSQNPSPLNVFDVTRILLLLYDRRPSIRRFPSVRVRVARQQTPTRIDCIRLNMTCLCVHQPAAQKTSKNVNVPRIRYVRFRSVRDITFKFTRNCEKYTCNCR